MHAEVIDLLTGKGKFPTEQGLAIAEAIDMTIEKAQLVTVPVLDARLAVLSARIDSLEIKMEAQMQRWTIRLIIAMLLSQTALGPIGVGAMDAARRALSTLVH